MLGQLHGIEKRYGSGPNSVQALSAAAAPTKSVLQGGGALGSLLAKTSGLVDMVRVGTGRQSLDLRHQAAP